VSSRVGPDAAVALLRRRTFGPYFAGNALSASGTWFQNLAAALLIYRQTHSALLLGVLNFSQFLPILLLAPWAGAASDRWNRRHLLFVTQPISIALSAGLGLLAYLDLAPPAVVIADAAALGVVSAFSAPAQQAMIPSLVEESEVPTAVALNSMTFNLARAIGPASAALAVEYLGIPAGVRAERAVVPDLRRRAGADRPPAAGASRAPGRRPGASEHRPPAQATRSSWSSW
jgi:MFS family permease